jgi:hypothetical protein
MQSGSPCCRWLQNVSVLLVPSPALLPRLPPLQAKPRRHVSLDDADGGQQQGQGQGQGAMRDMEDFGAGPSAAALAKAAAVGRSPVGIATRVERTPGEAGAAAAARGGENAGANNQQPPDIEVPYR